LVRAAERAACHYRVALCGGILDSGTVGGKRFSKSAEDLPYALRTPRFLGVGDAEVGEAEIGGFLYALFSASVSPLFQSSMK
jgi:hypothetical protein